MTSRRLRSVMSVARDRGTHGRRCVPTLLRAGYLRTAKMNLRDKCAWNHWLEGVAAILTPNNAGDSETSPHSRP